MACSTIPARCGPFSPTLVGSGVSVPLADFLLALLFGSLIGFFGALGIVELLGGASAIPGTAAAGTAAVAGGIAAVIAYIVLMVIIFVIVDDRCIENQGVQVCVSGGVLRVVGNSSPSLGESFFPFTMMHDRVDLVIQSRSWEETERNEAFVFCTSDPAPRTSEILRCYYFDPQICAAGVGALVGGGVAGLGGIVAGVAVAAAIGCATIIFCLLAILAAILIVVVAVLIGAVIGSNIGRASAEDRSPAATIFPGDYVGVTGPIRKRGFDGDANVMWWTDRTDMAGRTLFDVASTHCDINDLDPAC